MSTLTQAHDELFRRRPDECFSSVESLIQHCRNEHRESQDRWHLPARLQPTVVGGELSNRVRAQLVRLLKRLGPKYVGLRVWPIATEKSWLWEKEWISHEVSSPTASNEKLVATPANKLGENASTETKQSRPVQRELF